MATVPVVASRVVFARQSVIGLTRGARSVAAADFDGDGDTDVVAGSIRAGMFQLPPILWYENGGDVRNPSFTVHTVMGSNGNDLVVAVAAADVDGDGDTDVLSARFVLLEGGRIAWHENLGGSPRQFATHDISSGLDSAEAVASTDLDGDGDVDILSASFRDDTVAWYENDGAGPPSFTQHILTEDPDGFLGPLNGLADGATSVFAADLDGDGDRDVLVASVNNNEVFWFENQGGSPLAFLPHVITANAQAADSVVAADIDADGDLDVVAGSGNDDKVAWHENTGGAPPIFLEHVITEDPDGLMGPTEGFADGVREVRVDDVDGDGDLDVLSASIHDNRIAWYENLGGTPGAFRSHSISTLLNAAASVFAADLDGDGDTDVLSASINDNKVAWYENRHVLPESKR